MLNFKHSNKLSASLLWFIAIGFFSFPSISKAQLTEAYDSFEILPSSMFENNPVDFLDFNGKAAFTEYGSYSPVLWISDGTVDGTTKITFQEWDDIELGQTKTKRKAVVLNQKLFFTVYIDGEEHIWASDGTQEGTHEAVNGETLGFMNIRDIKTFGDRVAFIAYDIADAFERIYLINENGTGAQKLTDISRIYNSGIPPRMATINDDLFTVETVGQDRRLMKIDQQGTVSMVWQMPEISTDDFRSMYALTEAGNNIFFVGNDGTGHALWVFDGTSATRLFDPHKDAEQVQNVRNITPVNDKVYFFANPWDPDKNDFNFNSYLYVSDGTTAGTYQIWTSALDNGYSSHNASNYPTAAAGDRLLFIAPYSATTKNVLWGVHTSSSSFEVIEADGKVFKMGTGDPAPSPVTNGAWFYTLRDIVFTDGTTNGTYILPRGERSYVDQLATIDDRPWFTGRTTYSGPMSVWRALPVSESPPSQPTLLEPIANTDTVSVATTFKWKSVTGAESYRLQLSSDDTFSSIYEEIVTSDTVATNSQDLEENTLYFWRVRAEKESSNGNWSEHWKFTTRLSTHLEDLQTAPNSFTLAQNYPNPFNPTTQIQFGIPKASEVRLEVYNMLGQKVKTLVHERKSAGWHSVTFNASELTSGFYIYRIQADDFVSTKKLMLIK